MIVITVIALVIIGGYFKQGDLLQAVFPRPVPQTGAKTDREAPTRIFAAGIVEGIQSPLDLRFEMPGRIKVIRVREGDTVRENQVLAELESETYDLRIAQARARLQIAIAERSRLSDGSQSSGSSSQQRPVSQSGSVGTSRPTSAASTATREDILIANARVTAAEAVLNQEQLLLEKTRLMAPMDGVILAVSLKVGEVAGQAGESSSFLLVNRSKTRVRAFVEEYDAAEVAVGQRAAVVTAGNSKQTYSGTILSCAPVVQPKSHRHLNPGERLDVRVREIIVELNDGSNLLIGLPVEVFIDGAAPSLQTGPPSQTATATAIPRKNGSTSRARSNSPLVKP